VLEVQDDGLPNRLVEERDDLLPGLVVDVRNDGHPAKRSDVKLANIYAEVPQVGKPGRASPPSPQPCRPKVHL
jgi:hypothetical protein